MPTQFDIRNPNYLKAWSAFRDERSAKDLIHILDNELNSSSIYKERMSMLTSLKKNFPNKKGKEFFSFLESERKRLGLKWSIKTEDFVFPKEGVILDIMCGTGIVGNLTYHYLKSLGKNPKLIYGDFASKMLNNIESEVIGSQKLYLDVRNMKSIASSSVNLIVCRYGFNNLSQNDWKKAFREVFRVLVPRGLFIIQDHFVPGKFFSSFVNTFEYFIALLDERDDKPFIFSTEELNAYLDNNRLVLSRYHTGHSLYPSQKERLKLKSDFQNTDFSQSWKKYVEFSKGLIPLIYHLLITKDVPIYNITYGIRKSFRK